MAGTEDPTMVTSPGTGNPSPSSNERNQSTFQRIGQNFKNNNIKTTDDDSDPKSFLLLCEDQGRDVKLASLDVSKKKCDNTFYHAINKQHHGTLYKYWRFLVMRQIKTVEFMRATRDSF
jgi:hypothetical protein